MRRDRQRIGWIAVLLAILLPFAAVAKDKPEDSPLMNYSITGTGQPGSQGSYMVKVSVTTKNSKLADREIAKCAVHGVLFHGFSNGSHSEKPLARSGSTEEEHNEFFKSFFETQAVGYANPMPTSREVTKINKKEYVITEIVEVQKDRLKQTLKDAGVIKGLNTGF